MQRKLAKLIGALAVAVLITVGAAPPSGANVPKAYAATLSGDNEVPPSGSDAEGQAQISLNAKAGRVCVDITLTTPLQAPVAAMHIHEAPAGVNGPVVLNLQEIVDGAACARNLTSPEEMATIRDVRANPENYYLNVHTAAVPSGEVRGQVARAIDPL